MVDAPGVPPGVRCAHCGGRHANAAGVRACARREHGAARPSSLATKEPWAGGALPPNALGRSVVVRPGEPAPPACAGLARARGDLAELEEAWRARVPLVIEADDEPEAEETEHRPVYSLGPDFSFPAERRAHATFANAYDARGGQPRWPLIEVAARLGARPGGPADVLLPDGRPAYLDGGPFTWLEALDGAGVVSRLALAGGSLAPFGPNEPTEELAPDQRAAVAHRGGAARVVAPAGSGKTRVLAARARHLLGQGGLPGRALTLVAFNRRAAEEMRARTGDLASVRVRTLNALGLSLLGDDNVTTIDERAVRAILDDLVDLPRRANTDPAATWMEALSAVRLGLQPPEVVEATFGGDVDGLGAVFDRYRANLSERGVVDFDEQVYRAIEILITDPARRRRARAACGMLLVDEFQDLTPAHLLLVRLLAGPEGAVFGVGDDDQTIYGYTGASPRWLIDYPRYFPGAGAHALGVNYRCPVAVVEAAATLLTHNRARVDKTITPAPGRERLDADLTVRVADDPVQETLAVVRGLLETASPAEIAVLTRVNAALAPVQVGLVHAGVPVQRGVDESYCARSGVQAALAWLRLGVAGTDDLVGHDVALALRRPARGLSARVVGWAAEQRSVSGLERLAGRLKGRDAEKIASFARDLRRVAAVAARRTTTDVLRAVRDEVGLGRALAQLDASRRLDRSAQGDDLDALVALGALAPEPAGFEAFLVAALAVPGDPGGVALATVHRVKGREWRHVVLHDVRDGLFPHRLAEDREEERRVFHVGLTRATVSLAVVAGVPSSPFVVECENARVGGTVPDDTPRRRRVTEQASASGVIHATTGLAFALGGLDYVVHSVGDDGVVARCGRVSNVVPYGTLVAVARRRARLVAPVESAAAQRARTALSTWRAERARQEKKPAYVYFHDRTLDALAAALPDTMDALAAVPGIGPGKLAAYGDEILALLATARRGGENP